MSSDPLAPPISPPAPPSQRNQTSVTSSACIDPFGRTIDYLRISVTDRCNERCLYCMPAGYRGWSQRSDHLTAPEIIRVAAAATRIGFRKFRVTGGEPLIRSDILSILQGLWELPGVQTLGLSTNGTLLEALAPAIRRAGVRSLNVSLDALDPELYRRITGGDLNAVLRGLTAAQQQGFEIIKINCVLLRGVNESQFESLVEFAATHDFPLRFIELMPLPGSPEAGPNRFLSVQELMRRLQQTGHLTPLTDYRPGHGPARYHLYQHHRLSRPARLGFISAVTDPNFCQSCNKLRLTADGKLRPCLGRAGEVDLRTALRQGTDPTDLLRQTIAGKPENHLFQEGRQPGRPMTALGG